MAALTPVSTGATLEGAFLEVTQQLREKQINTTSNPDGTLVITSWQRDNLTGEISGSFTLPSVASIDADGNQVVNATEVFS